MKKNKQILMPLPSSDFDPTEAAVIWRVLKESGISVTFTTPDARPSAADKRMITGEGLGVWSSFLKADSNGLMAYFKMIQSREFATPLAWDKLNPNDYDGLVLPGGHAPGMKPYLESRVLGELVSEFFSLGKVVGAICHGTVLAARSRRFDGKSVLYGRRTTALLATQELAAWALTCLWLKNYYRTYPETVQHEVIRSLEKSTDFQPGPLPLRRDSPTDLQYGFVVQDHHYISARWPGDAHRFAHAIAEQLMSSTVKS